ncbi:putative exosome component 2 [Cryptosporidium felis]|nr:putative exosome component 2 [Cryptosporidium felis]
MKIKTVKWRDPDSNKLVNIPSENQISPEKTVIPGDVIHTEPNYIRGHGTFEDSNLGLISTTCGYHESLNKLIYTKPLGGRYVGEVGDIVVGRVMEVSNKKWLIDICSTQFAQLSLAAISLPGSVQRRRTEEDSLYMKSILDEGDVICTEVQRVQSEGLCHLHTRSAKYGKLANGILVKVSSRLIQRQIQHMVKLKYGVQLILGLNGFIWISLPFKHSHTDTLNYSSVSIKSEVVDSSIRKTIVTIAFVIRIIASNNIQLTPERICKVFDCFTALNLSYKDISLIDDTKLLLNSLE